MYVNDYLWKRLKETYYGNQVDILKSYLENKKVKPQAAHLHVNHMHSLMKFLPRYANIMYHTKIDTCQWVTYQQCTDNSMIPLF